MFNMFYLISSRTWNENEMDLLWTAFKKQYFYVHSHEDTSIEWSCYKIDEFKDRTIFKITNGGQTEIPFIYPYYKPDVKLRDKYTERIQSNLDKLKSYING